MSRPSGREGVEDLPYCAGAVGHIDIGGLYESHVEELRRHAEKLRWQMEHDERPAPKHGWTCFHCAQTFTTWASASAHFGDDPVKGRPVCCADALSSVYAEGERAGRRAGLEALKSALALIDDYLAYHHDGDPWSEDARLMGEMEINYAATDGRLDAIRALIPEEPATQGELDAATANQISGSEVGWRLDMENAPRDRIINAVARYPFATSGAPTYVGWDDRYEGWVHYSRHAPQPMVVWAWRERGEWPQEPQQTELEA